MLPGSHVILSHNLLVTRSLTRDDWYNWVEYYCRTFNGCKKNTKNGIKKRKWTKRLILLLVRSLLVSIQPTNPPNPSETTKVQCTRCTPG